MMGGASKATVDINRMAIPGRVVGYVTVPVF